MPEYTYTVDQEVHYYEGVEFDTPQEVIDWIRQGGEWDAKRNEVKSDRVRIYADGTLVADTDKEDTENTWTFIGHWENDRIVVEYVVPGDVQDPREDEGFWEQGLWAASASAPTQEAALAELREEYECHDDEDDQIKAKVRTAFDLLHPESEGWRRSDLLP